jgi:ABC-2 type transport system permease protein
MRRLILPFGMELVKLFARKRTWLGYGCFVGFGIAVFAILQLPVVQHHFAHLLARNGRLFSNCFGGLTSAFFITSNSVVFLGSLYLALVSGDLIAKEVEDGTLRLALCRPVGRAGIFWIKYGAAVVYTASLVLFIVVGSILGGALFKGLGNLFIYSPPDGVFAIHEPAEGLVRFALALPFIILSMGTVSALGFMFSALPVKPAAASIATLSILFIDMALRVTPLFSGIEPWLLTYHMTFWVHVFEPVILWPRIFESMLYLLAFQATFLTVGLLFFCQRDFKS